MADFTVALLDEHPHHVRTLVDLLHAEWAEFENWSDPEKLTATIQQRLQADAAPLAVIALDGDRLVGSASIKVHELSDHPDKQFWIGDVIVAKEYRGLGVGALLMREIVMRAGHIGIRELHLYTPDQEHYYRKLGWETIDIGNANGEDIVVMRMEHLDAKSPGFVKPGLRRRHGNVP